MKKIIITPLIGLGDVLMSFPALELLKKNIPDSFITYCAMNKGTFEVLRGNPHIDKLAYYPMLGPNKFAALFQLFRECAGRYSVAVNFYPSNRIHYNLFSLATLAPVRIGHTYLRKNFSQANWLKTRTIREDDRLHCVEENIALLELLGFRTAPGQIPAMKLYLDDSECREGLDARKKMSGLPVIGVHAGTSVFKGHAARRWPKERFAELIRAIPGAHFVLFGTAEEEETNRYILNETKATGRVSLVNDKTVRQVSAIIRACDFFISNDSGLMHIAAAVGTPVVAIIGPTNPAYIHPWGVEYKMITSPTPCLHCFRYSPTPLHCDHIPPFECLTGITVDAVAAAANEFLGRFAGRGLQG
jgi:ADP-heptose:LPS heptosyltransferase